MIMLQNFQQVNKNKENMFIRFVWFLRKLRKYKEIIDLYYCLIFMVLSRDMFQVSRKKKKFVKPQNEEKFKFQSRIFGLRILEFHAIDYYECKFYQDRDCLVGIFGTRCCKAM
jgi:hypothetical protein